MADAYIVTDVTTAELATLVSTSGLVDGCQYYNTETGKRYLATGVNTYIQVLPLGVDQAVVYTKKVTLTDAQIKTLRGTPVEIIPAPGIGKAIHADVALAQGGAILKMHWVADYGNVGDAAQFQFSLASIAYTNYGDSADVSGFLAWGLDSPAWLISAADATGTGAYYNDISSWENQNLNIGIVGGNEGALTGGNEGNTLDVIVFYTIIDL